MGKKEFNFSISPRDRSCKWVPLRFKHDPLKSKTAQNQLDHAHGIVANGGGLPRMHSH